jgi:hypothetical protein
MGKWDAEFAAVNSIDLDDANHTSDFAKIYTKEKQGTAIFTTNNGVVLYQKDISTFSDSYDKDWGCCFNVSGKDVDDYIKANVGGKQELKDFVSRDSQDFRFIINNGGQNLTVNEYKVQLSDDEKHINFYNKKTEEDYQFDRKDNWTLLMENDWAQNVLARFKLSHDQFLVGEEYGNMQLRITVNGVKTKDVEWQTLNHLISPSNIDFWLFSFTFDDLGDVIWEARDYEIHFISYDVDYYYGEQIKYDEIFKVNLTVNEPIDSKVTMNPIVFDVGSNGTTKLNLVGATVAKENISVDGHSEAVIDLKDNIVTVSNLTIGNYTLRVKTTPINNNYKSVEATTTVTVNKETASVNLTDVEFEFGKSGISTATVNGAILQNAYIANHAEANVTINDKQIIISNLSAGKYVLVVEFAADETHRIVSNNASANVTVNKAESSISLPDVTFEYLKTGSSVITVEGATVDKENITVEDHPEAVIDLNDNVITISNLTTGNYTLKVITTPDGNHFSSEATAKIVVAKLSSDLKVDVKNIQFGENARVTVTTNTLFSGPVSVKVGDIEKILYINNGGGDIFFENLEVGTYNVIVNLTETEIFKPANRTTTFVVQGDKPVIYIDPQLTITVDDIFVGQVAYVEITTNETYSGDVIVTINDLSYLVEVVNGEGSIYVPGLDIGYYSAHAIFEGDGVFKYSENTTDFYVKSAPSELIDPNLKISVDNITEGDVAIVKITANETMTGVEVRVKIGSYTFIVDINNGTGSLTVLGLTVGDYNATAIFKEDGIFKSSTVSDSFNVAIRPVNPKLTVSVSSVYKSQNAAITVTTDNTFTGTVNVKIGSKNYVVNVNKGKGTAQVSKLGVGTYTATATFSATEMFVGSVKSTTFKIKADVVKLTINKVKVKKSVKKVTIKATLKINGKVVKGKKITFKFNKKTYKATTNAKGIAKIVVKKSVLKKLKVGKKVTYLAKYSTKTAKQIVKVKK